MKNNNHSLYMQVALMEAEKAFNKNEVPVGAVIVKDNIVIAQAHNLVENKKSSVEHAELIAIRDAMNYLGNKYLNDCTLYVTLEPCVMCAGAILNSRISRLVYAADEPKTGCAGSILNLLQFPGFINFVHIVPNILEQESAELLKKFFMEKR